MDHDVQSRLKQLEHRIHSVEESVVDIADGQSELLEYMEDISSEIGTIRGSVEANRQAFLLLRAAQRDPRKSLMWIAVSTFFLYLMLRILLPSDASPA